MVTARTALITLAALGCALGAAVMVRRQPVERRSVLQPRVADESLQERKQAPSEAPANLAAPSPPDTSEREPPHESVPAQPLKLTLLRGSQLTILEVPP